ncbi:Uncharacterised protein [Mycobacterium tuberculosis]|nr:Uncharacterised protein [Mycobacterium tuberculosis]CKU52469.1 Uncharacterised protein [Mycobacterium tuberculosis]
MNLLFYLVKNLVLTKFKVSQLDLFLIHLILKPMMVSFV